MTTVLKLTTLRLLAPLNRMPMPAFWLIRKSWVSVFEDAPEKKRTTLEPAPEALMTIVL